MDNFGSWGYNHSVTVTVEAQAEVDIGRERGCSIVQTSNF
jgi:hypothetical protein